MDQKVYSNQAKQMVAEQIEARGISDQHVLNAMRQIPRHKFVGADLQARAYEDCALPIGGHQTISQPYIVALSLELAEIDPDDKVLEIGTGSGYQAALLGLLAGSVYTIEFIPDLAKQARARLSALGMDNVQVLEGDGSLGWAQAAPYDVIIAAAAAPFIPRALTDQLAEGGRLIIPVGDEAQQLERVRRTGQYMMTEQILPVRFVPMLGEVLGGN
jgi:protein-L-isoaspartate(D-aspartate) O-methyltransferase